MCVCGRSSSGVVVSARLSERETSVLNGYSIPHPPSKTISSRLCGFDIPMLLQLTQLKATPQQCSGL